MHFLSFGDPHPVRPVIHALRLCVPRAHRRRTIYPKRQAFVIFIQWFRAIFSLALPLKSPRNHFVISHLLPTFTSLSAWPTSHQPVMTLPLENLSLFYFFHFFNDRCLFASNSAYSYTIFCTSSFSSISRTVISLRFRKIYDIFVLKKKKYIVLLSRSLQCNQFTFLSQQYITGVYSVCMNILFWYKCTQVLGTYSFWVLKFSYYPHFIHFQKLYEEIL